MCKCKIAVFIIFKHREIGDVAKFKTVFINKVKTVCKFCSYLTCKIINMLRCIADEEQCIVCLRIKNFTKFLFFIIRKEFINRAFVRAVFKHFDIAKTLHTDFKCKFEHFLKPAFRLLCTARNVDTSNRSALECLEFNIAEKFR